MRNPPRLLDRKKANPRNFLGRWGGCHNRVRDMGPFPNIKTRISSTRARAKIASDLSVNLVADRKCCRLRVQFKIHGYFRLKTHLSRNYEKNCFSHNLQGVTMQSCSLQPKRQLGDSLRKFRLFSSNTQIGVSLNVGCGYVLIGRFTE